jgi:Tol biopolymer transport system component
MYVSTTKSGTIYTTDISGGPGREGVAVARLADGAYRALEKLGAPINVGTGNMYPFISPDERYLVFTRRRGGPGDTTLVVSFRNPDGSWGEPRQIDLGMPAGVPSVSPDGRYLFFTAGERGKSDIYWVSAAVLGARISPPS